jgi:mannose-6-phosphate isomerase-like protein (cupin superfamily)
MPKGKVVKVKKVMPFSPPVLKGEYISRMLIDEYNSGSKKLHVNHGTLKGGCSTPGDIHKAPWDEIYYVLSGEAVLHMDGVDYDIEKDTIVFIPGGTFHRLINKSKTEDFVIITIWPGQPGPGINGVYDMRKEAWGTTYKEVDDSNG